MGSNPPNQTRARGWRGVAGLLLLAGLPAAAPAQEAPQSAIPWLSESLAPSRPAAPAPSSPPQQNPAAPDPAQAAAPTAVPTPSPTAAPPLPRPNRYETEAPQSPAIAVSPALGPDRDAVGLIPAPLAGLPPDLWLGGESDRAIALLSALPPSPLPGIQDLMARILLSEAEPPRRADDALLLARIDGLLRRGMLEQAQALIERAGPSTAPLFRRWFDITLLTGDEDRACAALEANLALSPSPSARVFCLARLGRWSTAALTLDSAAALGDLDRETEALLARFLDPDLFEDQPPLTPSGPMTPLRFRLLEAIGDPLPTRPLPLAFAWSDLRFIAGWKAQLEAGERLARAGALPGNRLLGLYTERQAAASGALWDRVRAVQALDLALNSGDAKAAALALREADQRFAAAKLTPALAQMMAPRLARAGLTGAAADRAARLSLLAGQLPETLSDGADPSLALAVALMGGTPAEPPDKLPDAALAAAFASTPPPVEKAVAETLLAALTLLSPGSVSDPQDWARALEMLRAAGQEESARRIAADILLEGGPGA